MDEADDETDGEAGGARAKGAEARVEKHLALVTEQARAIAAQALGPKRTATGMHHALAHLFAYEKQTKIALVHALARDPRCLPVCAPGCAFCCHLAVFASVPEILALAAHLRATLAPAELAARTAEIAAAAAAVGDLDRSARAASKRACPLLDGESGRCTVYEARPLACRAYNSCDAATCERAFDQALTRWDVPVDLFQLTVGRNVRAGLLAAVHAGGLDPGPYELSVGLHLALSEPDAEARWLAGETVFAAAETRIGRARRAAWDAEISRCARSGEA